MGRIGNLGSLITFEVSSNKVLTFDGLQQTTRGRWAKHEVIGGKPVSEWLGADLRTLSFEVYLSAAHGVSPRRTIERLEQAAESGDDYRLVVGGRKIGSTWIVESVGSAWDKVLDGGELVAARLTVNLTEHA